MDPQSTDAPQTAPEQPAAPPTEQPVQAAESVPTTPIASQTDGAPKKGYGKRPIWQWVALYIVIAIVVYGLVYYFFLRNKGTGTSGY